MVELNAYLALAAAIAIGVAGQLVLKYGLARYPGIQLREFLKLIYNTWVVGGFACYTVSILFYLKALGSLDLSVTYPSISLGYALVVIFSKILFKDVVSPQRWIAVVIICVGVGLVGLGTS